MITEEHIKEAISLRYIELIAAFNGYKTSSSFPDYGTDLDIIEVDYRIENEQKRYSNTGRELKFQLKATTESSKSLIAEDDIIKYDLEAKSFNDLIFRRDTKNPLVLILFILPSEKSEWINVCDKELIAKKCAYWYFPELAEIITENTATKRISINKNNVITNETITQLFEKYS